MQIPSLLGVLESRLTFTMEFYLVIKKTKIMLYIGKWMELEIIRLSEISQIQKEKSHMFSFLCGI
jgi:hypothetical protein